MKKLKTDYPIDIGQEWRYKTMFNFKSIENFHQYIIDKLKHHKTSEQHAHNAKQIDYKLTNVHNELQYQDGRIETLVIGHNGDGVEEVKDSRTALDGTNQNLLSQRLKYDFEIIKNKMEENFDYLNKKIERIVNVNDYGADPTGKEDSTQAFQKASRGGNVHVHMTAGTYKITGVKLPNNTVLSGEGKDITSVRLADETPAENIAITNEDMSGQAHNIGIKDFTVNGNKWRQDKKLKPMGGSLSSNVRFAGVKHGFASNIKSVDALLHGFDVTYASDPYFYEGDGVRVNEELESKYIHIDNCEASGFGDDGITTHHSRYLVITNNYCHHATGGGNNNGIEIDDGSQHVMLDNNMTEENYGGVEVKAHGNSSAPNNVMISNHMSIKDSRAYNIRHIGHHRAGDPISKTAHSVILNNCSAITPYDNKVYPGTTPRALVISGYRNVQVSGYTAVGDGTYTANMPVVAVQFMSNNIMLNNINITGFKNSQADIKVFGGSNRGKKITISNVNIWNSSANRGIAGGGGIYDLRIINASLQGQGTGNGVELYNNTAEVIGVNAENYNNAAYITNKAYRVVPTAVKGGFSGGSTGAAAIAERSAVIATTGNSYAHSDRSWLAGVGAGSHAHGSRSSVMNSLESETLPGAYCQTIVNSRGVKSPGNYHFLLGYGTDGAKYENTTIDMSTISGNIKTKGTVSSGQNFGDYAEYFESQSGQEIKNGYIVTLDGRYIRKANSNDTPIGVISGTAGVILGDQMFHHKDKFLKDEFGVTQTELQTKEWQDDEGNWYSEEVDVPISNPEYVEYADEYIDRSNRPEWNVVGLMGQVYTRIDSTVSVNDYIKPNKGVGTKDNNNGFYRVLEITTPYDNEKEYGVAVVLVK
ncbi:peptidase G2 autoproteolytic cleavage domain-containing protein [Staphylococcus nepalensis]|uniref:peptidase G2 autoproteolytic cleavage domain-containing protein n=1 Tax=Staphylococcus nepalensis TaxID=214473 RepID=UPI000DFFCB62|nr:peptidase G2 autoproteolytic cleavage domain-containing protein [Staphylococcus nepalensis]SUM69771.1 Putative major teichoic acid biosynthesis protein C [Staphylococcus nepalensis]SUM96049.1 Putative major teichoic acid biosynthesis protein C [Staphylococcus nepalensis]